MLKPAVPSAVANRRRRVRPGRANAVQAAENSARGALEAFSDGARGSCFHSAKLLSDHREQRRALDDLDQADFAEMTRAARRRPAR